MVVNSNRMNFEEVINGYLKQYVGETAEGLTVVIPKVARQAAKKLKQTSPKRGGEYAAGWAVEIEKGRIRTGATVYGKKPTYRLAHLLEHGHARRGGGRDVPAIVHIKPVEEWAIEEATNQFIDYMEALH